MRTTGGAPGFLTRQPKPVLLGLSLLSVAALAWIDYATGYEVSFALFYLVPVGLTAWYIGRRTALAISLVSAACWLLANRLAGETYSNSLIVFWNTAIRLGFFVITTLLLVELRRALDRQRELARTDPLTGALNSRAFSEVALHEILRARRYGRPLTVAYLDLDNFKTVNDHLGHSTGDLVLQTVVTTIKTTLRGTDSVARMGGDEFVLILPETDGHAARLIAARIREQLAKEMLGRQWPVTASVGVVTCREPPEAVDALLQVADGLMYSAKRDGKDGIHHLEYRSTTVEQATVARQGGEGDQPLTPRS